MARLHPGAAARGRSPCVHGRARLNACILVARLTARSPSWPTGERWGWQRVGARRCRPLQPARLHPPLPPLRGFLHGIRLRRRISVLGTCWGLASRPSNRNRCRDQHVADGRSMWRLAARSRAHAVAAAGQGPTHSVVRVGVDGIAGEGCHRARHGALSEALDAEVPLQQRQLRRFQHPQRREPRRCTCAVDPASVRHGRHLLPLMGVAADVGSHARFLRGLPRAAKPWRGRGGRRGRRRQGSPGWARPAAASEIPFCTIGTSQDVVILPAHSRRNVHMAACCRQGAGCSLVSQIAGRPVLSPKALLQRLEPCTW